MQKTVRVREQGSLPRDCVFCMCQGSCPCEILTAWLPKQSLNNDKISEHTCQHEWGTFHRVPLLDEEIQAINNCPERETWSSPRGSPLMAIQYQVISPKIIYTQATVKWFNGLNLCVIYSKCIYIHICMKQ